MRLRLCGLKIDISIPLAAAMAAVIVFDTTMSVVICLSAVILHECGHLFMLKRFGSFPKHIRLTLFDFVIVDNKKSLRSDSQELVVTLAGVCVNFCAAAAAFIAGQIFRADTVKFIEANLSLAVFNSLPVDTLDGGQALLLILARYYEIRRAMLIVDIVSFIILTPAACAGFLLLFRSGGNFTLLLTSVYLIALLLIKRSKRFPKRRIPVTDISE